MISIHPYGDSAVLVNFEQKIERNIHQKVLTLYDALTEVEGIRYMIPAHCSLTVAFDPLLTSASELQELITASGERRVPGTEHRVTSNKHRILEIPVCYDGDMGPDLEEVSVQTGKTIDEIIRAHLNTEFYVYMLGFMPGFAYMGDMPDEYYCHRKSQPRTKVPPGSVALSGKQTGIYSFESPGGWQIIGRTPVTLFDPTREQPALLAPGDKVRFTRVSEEEYERLLS